MWPPTSRTTKSTHTNKQQVVAHEIEAIALLQAVGELDVNAGGDDTLFVILDGEFRLAGALEQRKGAATRLTMEKMCGYCSYFGFWAGLVEAPS